MELSELVTTALLGTAKHPPGRPAATAEPLDRLVDQLAATDSERYLLGAVAAVTLYQRVGRRPMQAATQAVSVAPPDERAICRPAAQRRLEQLLGGRSDDLLDEWLTAVAAAGQRVHAVALPGLLERGRREAGRRELIRAVIGERGRWLASQNPDWSYAVVEALDESVWAIGTPEARLQLVRELRRVAPERARELVASGFASERPSDRAAFLDAFSVGLSLADEALLEMALDDRRSEVRSVASRLLASLPESRLVQRMRERVAACLSYVPPQRRQMLALRGGAPARLEVTLPAACDAAMVRDGIVATRPRHEPLGERAWWLRQMLAIVPPRHWSQRWEVEPPSLLGLARQTEWDGLLLGGWAQAAQRHQDEGWAAALLAVDSAQPALLTALSSAARERLLVSIVQAAVHPPTIEQQVYDLLAADDFAWGPTLTRTALAAIRRWIASDRLDDRTRWRLQQLLPGYALRMAPQLANEAVGGWPMEVKAWTYLAESVDRLVTVLQFRHDMLKEIAE